MMQHALSVCGRTDLRYGIDGLVGIIKANMTTDRPEPNTLFLFCGRRKDRIKGIVWEEDGYLLLYKRLTDGSFCWPRDTNEVRNLTPQQFRWLMEGLTIEPKKIIKQSDKEYLL